MSVVSSSIILILPAPDAGIFLAIQKKKMAGSSPATMRLWSEAVPYPAITLSAGT
jgi:hypothetical protein